MLRPLLTFPRRAVPGGEIPLRRGDCAASVSLFHLPGALLNLGRGSLCPRPLFGGGH